MALFQTLEIEQDVSGKTRVRVSLGDESIFLKFQSVPTQDDVDWAVIDYVTVQNALNSQD